MATVNFSVPGEVKQTFDEAFAQEKKSAILIRLKQRAIEEAQIKKRRYDAIEAILALREKQGVVSADDISNAREELRK